MLLFWLYLVWLRQQNVGYRILISQMLLTELRIIPPDLPKTKQNYWIQLKSFLIALLGWHTLDAYPDSSHKFLASLSIGHLSSPKWPRGASHSPVSRTPPWTPRCSHQYSCDGHWYGLTCRAPERHGLSIRKKKILPITPVAPLGKWTFSGFSVMWCFCPFWVVGYPISW